MHDIIKAGIERMRDSQTCQTRLVERRVQDDGTECFCALGCICQESIDRGIGQWERSDGKSYFLALGPSPDDELKASYFEWYDELASVVGTSAILSWNDSAALPLPMIADRIEAKYQAKEATS